MGFKTTNYYIEKTGLMLPEAYAMISKIDLWKNIARVTFAIQTTREAIIEKMPLETKTLNIVWDRKADIAKLAYEEAKNKFVEQLIDEESGETVLVEIKGLFDGWEDDIVKENIL